MATVLSETNIPNVSANPSLEQKPHKPSSPPLNINQHRTQVTSPILQETECRGRSTVEVEYRAMACLTCELIWARQLLQELLSTLHRIQYSTSELNTQILIAILYQVCRIKRLTCICVDQVLKETSNYIYLFQA